MKLQDEIERIMDSFTTNDCLATINKYIIFNLRFFSEEAKRLLNEMAEEGLIVLVKDNRRVNIGRWGTNITALKKLLAKNTKVSTLQRIISSQK